MSCLYEIAKSDNQAMPNVLSVGTKVTGQCDCFDLRRNGTCLWQVKIGWESPCSPFAAQLVWEQANVALFGAHNEIYALRVDTGAVVMHKVLESYFGYFELVHGQILLVLTGTRIVALDTGLRTMWQTAHIAVDGIVFREVIDRFLMVEVELDPPGGWQCIKIDLHTGVVYPLDS